MKNICKVENCSGFVHGIGYCAKHYRQFKNKGHAYKTFREPNDFIIEKDFCKIALMNRQSKIIAYAIIDIEDIEKCKNIKWHIVNKYTYSDKLGYLHHLILGKPPTGFEIDHANGNKLDNRKINLRFCTSSQNNYNQKLRTDNTSGYKGVRFNKHANKWVARIHVNKKEIHLGCFDNLIKAIDVRNQAALKYHGEFANHG